MGKIEKWLSVFFILDLIQLRFMKQLLFLFLFSQSIQGKAGEIDNLKSDKDVSRFLKTKFKYVTFDLKDTSWVYSTNSKLIQVADSLNVKYWFVEDFDSNQEKDLFAYGYAETKQKKNGFLEVLVILSDKGKFKKISLRQFYGGMFASNDIFPAIVKVNSIPLILVHTLKVVPLDNSVKRNENFTSLQTDTLTFKNGCPLLYSSAFFNPEINRINFKTSGCFGTCPIFEMTIMPSKDIMYKAIKYNSEYGSFSCRLSLSDYEYIVSCLIASKFTELKDIYEVNWTDDQTATLEIEYDNGKVKQISDYGMQSNISLMFLYKRLYDLRTTVKKCK